jgi:CheY-like chemotaxis protein
MDDQSGAQAMESSPGLITIFVVEDDADLSFMLLRFLEEEVPCRVVLTTDDVEALQLVRSITPQLFLLDYHLPRMTGLQLAGRLRAIPPLEHTPIILMSARMPRNEINERQLQAIHKPFDFDDLLRLVRDQLPGR